MDNQQSARAYLIEEAIIDVLERAGRPLPSSAVASRLEGRGFQAWEVRQVLREPNFVLSGGGWEISPRRFLF